MTVASGHRFSVDTSPTKEVVVSSLTRDASVEACLFDLIDNSVDAARDTALSRVDNQDEATLIEDYSGFEINLSVSGTGLKIVDNCGGISVEKLRTMVMRFGQRSAHKTGIGIFGVGLNRALFRIGKITHLRTDTGAERSELVLNVEEYLKKQEWDLPAESFASKGKVGTEIEITKPSSEVSQLLADADFEGRLRAEIGLRYARFLKKGIEICLNGAAIDGSEVLIRENSPFSEGLIPKFFHFNGVSIYICYGQHYKHRFTNEPDYDPEINKPLTPEFGWTILCNDRTVLLNDRTFKTGWDKFHSEFYGFVGTVSFVSDDPSLLPWTTTKDDVDLNSPVYQRALEDMRTFAKKWRTFSEERKKKAKKGEVIVPIPPVGDDTKVGNPPAPPTLSPKRPGSPSRRPIKQPVVKVDHNQSRNILPQDIDEAHCEDKLLALVHEAKSVDIGTHSYAALALMRMLFETAVVCHATRHQYAAALKDHTVAARKAQGRIKNATEEKRAVPSLEESLDFLDGNQTVWGAIKATHLVQSIGRLRSQKPRMNAALHNPWQTIDRTEVFQIRTELLPLLRHLIED